jgi:DNA-directed RNA polymerase sigma subunit (sigma70/sigma32)
LVLGADVKRGTLGAEGSFEGVVKSTRMGVSRNQDDAPGPELVDSDAETMRDLQRLVEQTPALTAAEQKRLLERAALGDRASQERLVAAHLGLVIRLAADQDVKGFSMPDLVQEGSIGLVEAVRTFAGSGQQDFTVFAEQAIRAQLAQALGTEAAAVRDAELLLAAATDYEHAQMVIRRELRREATEAEIAEKLEWTVERTRYVATVVVDARRRHDEEMLEFIDPADIDFDGDERVEFGS